MSCKAANEAEGLHLVLGTLRQRMHCLPYAGVGRHHGNLIQLVFSSRLGHTRRSLLGLSQLVLLHRQELLLDRQLPLQFK